MTKHLALLLVVAMPVLVLHVALAPWPARRRRRT